MVRETSDGPSQIESPDEVTDWRVEREVTGEQEATLPKKQRPFYNGVILLARGVFRVLAILTRQDFWRLNPLEERDLASAITGWTYSLKSNRSKRIIAFFTDVAPTLTLLLTVGGIFEVRLREAGALRRLQASMVPRPAPPQGTMRETAAEDRTHTHAPAPVVVPSPDAIEIPPKSELDPVHPAEAISIESLAQKMPAEAA